MRRAPPIDEVQALDCDSAGPRQGVATSAHGLMERRTHIVASGAFLAYLADMSVQITLPDELADQIDHVAKDRDVFVAEAVRRLLHDTSESTTHDEIARINEVADELNREAEDVLEYQVIS